MNNNFAGTSWSCPSPTLTPPFPLPPLEAEDDPVEALLQLAQRGRTAVPGSGAGCTADTAASPASTESLESDEGIVSDQSLEFESGDNKKRLKVGTVTTSAPLYSLPGQFVLLHCIMGNLNVSASNQYL